MQPPFAMLDAHDLAKSTPVVAAWQQTERDKLERCDTLACMAGTINGEGAHMAGLCPSNLIGAGEQDVGLRPYVHTCRCVIAV